MNALDISRINETSPYKVSLNQHGYLQFTTQAGVVLAVDFDEDDILQTESYWFIITNSNNKPSPRDAKVRDTVFAIITEFFRVNNATVLYICESGDGRQAMRSRLFSHWFTTFADNLQYTYFQSSIVDAEGVTNFFAAITRTDNPNLHSIMTEINKAVSFFRHKPNDQ